MDKKVKKLVGIALFTAIVVVLQLWGSGIKVGMFSISLVLIPIVVGAALYGWDAGAWLGFVFGGVVLLSGDAAPFMAVDVLGTIVTVLVKGTACGLAAGLVYKLVAGLPGNNQKVKTTLAVVAAALICPFVNTGIFLLGCRLFFFETITAWGSAAGFANVGAYMIVGLVGFNFLVEVATNMVLAPVIVRLIKIGKKN